MGDVLLMPGVDPASIRPRPLRVQEMQRHQRALVVVTDGTAFAIVRRPADGADEMIPRSYFTDRAEALQLARRTAASCPAYYPMVIDDTPHGLRSLDRILGLGPDPMGVKHLPDGRGKARF